MVSSPGKLIGKALALYVFDVGFAIDVAKAAERVGANLLPPPPGLTPAPKGAPSLERVMGANRDLADPYGTTWKPAPLRFRTPSPVLPLGPWKMEEQATVAVHPFGALSVTLGVTINDPQDRIQDLSIRLARNSAAEAIARQIAVGVMATLGDAIETPAISSLVEDYRIFLLEPTDPPPPESVIVEWVRGSAAPASPEEHRRIMERRHGMAPGEVAWLDWEGGVLLGRDLEDEVRVLELANMLLLELRVLDHRIDGAVADAWEALRQARTGWRRFTLHATTLHRIARLQVDGVLLHESATNALKILEDDELARFHRLATDRLSLGPWSEGIARKLGTLDGIYGKLADLAAQRRGEILEWIIIILIAVDLLAIALKS